jgi:hypothetical protein
VTAVYNNQCESEVSQVGPFGCYFSVEEKTVQKSINIIPNPASDFIEISSIYSITGIGITDSWGVLKYRNDAIKETEYRLNVSGFPPGLYFISVITEKGTTTQKVVVMH